MVLLAVGAEALTVIVAEGGAVAGLGAAGAGVEVTVIWDGQIW